MWKYGAGAGLKTGGGLALLLFDFFKIYLFLHSEIILISAKLCHIFERKLLFLANIILFKKFILRCLKISLCVCVSKLSLSD